MGKHVSSDQPRIVQALRERVAYRIGTPAEFNNRMRNGGRQPKHRA